MAEDRIFKLEEKQSAFEKWGWKTISSLIMALGVFLLNGINSNLKELNQEIVTIKLADSANGQRMNRLEDDVSILKAGEKEIIKRVSAIERVSEKHEHQLKRWDK